jgi:hypothetical protein
MFVASPIIKIHVVEDISECILERNLSNALCGKAFNQHSHRWHHERIILERNLINVLNVTKPLLNVQISLNTRESMLERNLTNVLSAAKLLPNLQTLLAIRKYIMKRNIVNICGNAFIQSSSLGIREFVIVENVKYSV